MEIQADFLLISPTSNVLRQKMSFLPSGLPSQSGIGSRSCSFFWTFHCHYSVRFRRESFELIVVLSLSEAESSPSPRATLLFTRLFTGTVRVHQVSRCEPKTLKEYTLSDKEQLDADIKNPH